MRGQFLRTLACCGLIAALSACSSSVEPPAVSKAQYQGYNCKQIQAEMQRISSKLEQANKTDTTGKIMDTALGAFAISQGMGWSSDDNSEASARLQSQYDVLSPLAIQKECFDK